MRLRFIALLTCLATDLLAQQPRAVLVAHVIDANTGSAVPGTEVTVVGTEVRGRTDSLGRATFSGMGAGKISVEARHIGFGPVVVELTIPQRDTIEAVLLLHTATPTLPIVKVVDSADSHTIPEFEARLKSHIGGYFVTEKEIRANQSSTIANLIRGRIPGVLPVVGSDRKTTVYSTRSVDKCKVLVFLDGVRLLYEDISIVGLESLGGIEYYPPGYAPVQYRVPPAIEPQPPRGGTPDRGPRAECGVLLLWTRR